MKRKASNLDYVDAPARKYIKQRGVTTSAAKRYYKRKGKTPFGDTGSIIGKKLSGVFGLGDSGADIGRWIGSGLGRALFGSGDYKGNLEQIATNTIVNPSQSTPQIISGVGKVDGDSLVVRRTEYIKDIVSSPVANTFAVETFAVNPGQRSMFPFLSQIAVNYEEYRVRGMVVHFKSLSGDSVASVQSGLGYVAMATQYDALDATFVNKAAIENYSMSQSGKPSIDQIHGIECHPQMNALTHLYVRSSSQPANTDLRLYDLGKFSIANSCPGTSVTLGELWISYDIELFKPKVPEVNQDAGAKSKVSRGSLATTTLGFGTIGLQTTGSLLCTPSSTQMVYSGLDPNAQYLFSTTWAVSTGNLTAIPSITFSKGGLVAYWATNDGVTINSATSKVAVSPAAGNTHHQIRVLTPNAAGEITADLSAGTISVSANFSTDVLLVNIEK